MQINFTEMAARQKEAAELALEGEIDRARCAEAFEMAERLVLPLTNYSLSARPHPDLADAHYGLWLMASALAIRGGFMSRALFAARQAMASGPVDDDYELLCVLEDAARKAVETGSMDIPEKAADTGAICLVAQAKVDGQAVKTPVVTLSEYAPICDANETHVDRIRREAGSSSGPAEPARQNAAEVQPVSLDPVIETVRAENRALEAKMSAMQLELEGMRVSLEAIMDQLAGMAKARSQDSETF